MKIIRTSFFGGAFFLYKKIKKVRDIVAKGKTRLKGLEVSKVDFVDEGANPEADIRLLKRQGPDEGRDGFLKGLFSCIKKYVSAVEGEEPNGVEKAGAQSFADKMSERNTDHVRDEMWNVCYALQGSLISILLDEDLDEDGKQKRMEQSAAEFSQAVQECIAIWSKGKSAGVVKRREELFASDAETLEEMRSVLDDMIEKSKGQGAYKNHKNPAVPEIKKGGSKEMKIDKSKMTPEDAARFEQMAKAYGWEEDEGTVSEPGIKQPEAGTSAAEDPSHEAGVEKGLHPMVQAELEALRKVRETLEEQTLRDIAKKYEGIGKKAEDLVPVLKSMKAAGDDSYQNYIAALDELVAIQESSGMFAEIGKSGHGSSGVSTEMEAFAKAQAKAAEIKKTRPDLSDEEAIMMAVDQDPELLAALQ